MVRIVCAWCQKTMGFKDSASSEQSGQVTHSICEECAKEQLENFNHESRGHSGRRRRFSEKPIRRFKT